MLESVHSCALELPTMTSLPARITALAAAALLVCTTATPAAANVPDYDTSVAGNPIFDGW
jgi:hypothetical protein